MAEVDNNNRDLCNPKTEISNDQGRPSRPATSSMCIRYTQVARSSLCWLCSRSSMTWSSWLW